MNAGTTILGVAVGFVMTGAYLLVLYFGWRGSLRRRILAEGDRMPTAPDASGRL